MKIPLYLLLFFLFIHCEILDNCHCEYVVYEKDEGERYTETYRSTWDASCEDEVLSEDVFTFDGFRSYSKTVIECK